MKRFMAIKLLAETTTLTEQELKQAAEKSALMGHVVDGYAQGLLGFERASGKINWLLAHPLPWPKCSKTCGIVRKFGVGECENVCPEKFPTQAASQEGILA